MVGGNGGEPLLFSTVAAATGDGIAEGTKLTAPLTRSDKIYYNRSFHISPIVCVID